MIRISATGIVPMNLNWWKPTQREWVPVLMDAHPAFWRRQVDHTTGRPWARLNTRYEMKKAQQYPGEPILRATGAMQDASYIFTKGDQFLVRSTPYGAFHQFGTSKMPERPWTGVPDIALEKLPPIAWQNILSRKR